MKAPNKELREFVYNLLYNKVSVAGVVGYIPVVSLPGKTQAFPFIELGNIGLTDYSTKTEYLTKATLEIGIYTRFADENANYNICELISNEIIDKITDQKGDTANFEIFASRFLNSQETVEQTDTDKVIYNTLNFEFSIEQL